jgi:hypothetical protein
MAEKEEKIRVGVEVERRKKKREKPEYFWRDVGVVGKSGA